MQRRGMLRDALLFALPAIFENLMVTLVSMVDTAMVGVLGAQATAATALNASPNWLVNSAAMIVSGGTTVLIAHLWGAKDYERAGLCARQSLVWAILLGILLTLAAQCVAPYYPHWMQAEPGVAQEATAYMRIVSAAYIPHVIAITLYGAARASGDLKTPMRISLGVNLLNVVGNFLLIYETRTLPLFGGIRIWGAGMGVRGAALSTAISMGLSGLAMLFLFSRRQDALKLTRRDSYSLRGGGRILRVGLPVATERVIIQIGQILFASIVSSLGTIPLSAHHLAVTAEGVCYNPAFGLSSAAMTSVGQSMGAKLLPRAQREGRTYLVLCLGVMLLVSAMMYGFAPWMIGVFTPDAQVVEMGAMALRIVALAEPLFGLSIVGTGILRSAGDASAPVWIGLFCMLAVRVPLAYLFVHGLGWGLAGAWIAMDIDLALRGLLTVGRFFSGRWKSRAEIPA